MNHILRKSLNTTEPFPSCPHYVAEVLERFYCCIVLCAAMYPAMGRKTIWKLSKKETKQAPRLNGIKHHYEL